MNIDINDKKELEEFRQDPEFDYESIEILQDYKVKFFEKVLRQAVDRKYKISFYKGMQIVFESLVLLVTMFSVCLKANLFSIIYLLFIARYLTSKAKTQLLARATAYISLCFLCQYFLYMFNLCDATSPARFPK